MRKFLSCCLIALSLTSFTPKAHAVGGLMTGQFAIAAIGGVSMAGSIPLFTLANRLRGSQSQGRRVGGLVVGIVASIMYAGGMWFLDNENNDFEFLPVVKANLTPAEAIYNSELPELNAVKDMIAADLENTELNTLEEINTFVGKKWAEYGQGLSPETLQMRAQIVADLAK